MFDEPHEIEVPDGTRLTVRSAAARALILEVHLPPDARAPWISALASYGRRFEVLHGALLIDGAAVRTGERLVVERGREIALAGTAAADAHFVCDLQPAGDRAALIAALAAWLASRATEL
jgi:hypothetical protein